MRPNFTTHEVKARVALLETNLNKKSNLLKRVELELASKLLSTRRSTDDIRKLHLLRRQTVSYIAQCMADIKLLTKALLDALTGANKTVHYKSCIYA